MSIDPRLMERRRTVAEDKAKKNVSRLLKFLALLVVIGAVVWLAFSPWLSVAQVDATGIEVSTANSILAERGVVAGTPMIRISVDGTEQALLQDPWIASAEISRNWPDRVSVEIVERTPTAWTRTAEGWTRRSSDGVALPSGSEPNPEMAWIDLPSLGSDAAADDPDMLGALEFVASLAPRLHPGTTLYENGDEIWATVSGFEVRLGRGVDMAAKALSLQALLAEELPADATLVLIAPAYPAVRTSSGDTVSEETGDDADGAAPTEEETAEDGGGDDG